MPQWFQKGWSILASVTGAYGFLTSELFKLYLWPVLAGGAVAAAAYFIDLGNNVPVSFLLTAILVAMAAMATFLLRIDEWRERNRIRDKLVFSNAHIGIAKRADGTITTVQLGAILCNRAHFPISYKVTSIQTVADSTLPSEGSILCMGGVLAPQSDTVFRDLPIQLKVPKNDFEALLHIVLLYGRKGREKYPLSKKINLSIRHDPKTGQLDWPWLEAPEG